MKRFIFIMFVAMAGVDCSNNKILHREAEIEWSVGAMLPPADGVGEQPGLAGPVAGIINNRLLVSGGANFPDGMPWRGAKKAYHDEIYLFEKENGRLGEATVSKQRLPQPVAYCANVMTPDGLVYLGGENEEGISDRVVLIGYDKIKDGLLFSNLPSLPLPLTNLAAACNGHMIYVAGGTSKGGNSDKLFSLNVSRPGEGWQSLPDIPVKVSYAVMVIQSNGEHDCIYLIGGRRKNSDGLSDILNTVYQFDLESKDWKRKQSIPYSISAGTGVADGSNDILLLGGDNGETFSQEEKISAAIRDEKDEERSKHLLKDKISLLEAHPGFITDVLLYNTINDTWERTRPLPPGSPVTTTAIKWGNDIIIPSGEIKAGVRTPRILIGKPTRP